MKTKKLKTKLVLNKRTVVNIDRHQMNSAHGGVLPTVDSCRLTEGRCETGEFCTGELCACSALCTGPNCPVYTVYCPSWDCTGIDCF